MNTKIIRKIGLFDEYKLNLEIEKKKDFSYAKTLLFIIKKYSIYSAYTSLKLKLNSKEYPIILILILQLVHCFVHYFNAIGLLEILAASFVIAYLYYYCHY